MSNEPEDVEKRIKKANTEGVEEMEAREEATAQKILGEMEKSKNRKGRGFLNA